MKEPLTLSRSVGGLGSFIAYLSMIIDTGKPVILKTRNTVFDHLKKIFRIPDNQLTVIFDENHIDDDTEVCSDTCKIFNPYFDVKTIHVLGQNFEVNTNNIKKSYIGLACYQDFKHLTQYDKDDLTWPNYRYYSIEEYAELVKFIKQIGYEVLTLDARDSSPEQKVYLINEMCQCVIGYEGGMHHIAHLLKIPSIILPWRQWSSTDIDLDELMQDLMQHLLHLDTRTYFAKSLTEITRWDQTKFNEMIEKLNNEKGNNIFINKDVYLANDLQTLILNVGTESNPDFRLMNDSLNLCQNSINFIMKEFNTDTLTMMGKPVKRMEEYTVLLKDNLAKLQKNQLIEYSKSKYFKQINKVFSLSGNCYDWITVSPLLVDENTFAFCNSHTAYIGNQWALMHGPPNTAPTPFLPQIVKHLQYDPTCILIIHYEWCELEVVRDGQMLKKFINDNSLNPNQIYYVVRDHLIVSDLIKEIDMDVHVAAKATSEHKWPYDFFKTGIFK